MLNKASISHVFYFILDVRTSQLANPGLIGSWLLGAGYVCGCLCMCSKFVILFCDLCMKCIIVWVVFVTADQVTNTKSQLAGMRTHRQWSQVTDNDGQLTDNAVVSVKSLNS